MPVVHLIIGLPGSGKTHFARQLGVLMIDDITDLSELPDRGVGDFAITDPHFCKPRTLANAVRTIASNYPDHHIVQHWFENDARKALRNVAYRNDGRVVRGLVLALSSVYKPPSDAMRIWQGDDDVGCC